MVVFWSSSALVVMFLVLVLKVCVHQWWKPRKMEKYFLRQGIRGPVYQLFLGNMKELGALMLKATSQPMPFSHNILPRVLPFFHHWKKLYGDTFLIWFGARVRVVVSDPALIREILCSKSFEKYDPHPNLKKLEGNSLLNLKGDKWAFHRRIISPSFHTRNLNLMIPAMAKSVENMLEKWGKISGERKEEEMEIDVCHWFELLTEEIIIRTAFGCGSYEDGKAIFDLQTQQMVFATQSFTNLFIPGYRFLPTKQNRRCWKLDRDIRKSLTKMIESRRVNIPETKNKDSGGIDLLGMMIRDHLKSSSSSEAVGISFEDLIEECKGFFFAGKHNTSNLLTWSIVLLAMHPDSQRMAREEVIRVCGRRNVPTKDDIANLKQLGMILNESLRLYPPTVATIRRSKEDVLLGGKSIIPSGTEVLMPILAVHHDRELWGSNVNEFDPTRFANGAIKAATHPNAFVPFGCGPRKCVGQNLVILQAKLVVAMILRRFEFRLSSSYVHAPTVHMLLHPQHGAPIVFSKYVDL